LNEKYEELENIFINLEERFNNKIRDLTTRLIKVENFSKKLRQIIENILDKYIPLL